MVQWVKNMALSLQWSESLLCHGFDPWLESSHMLLTGPRKKEKKIVGNIFGYVAYFKKEQVRYKIIQTQKYREIA